MPPRSSPELPGPEQRLGPYRLLRPVSAGGMARVYEGRLDSLAGVSTRVAVKVIHPEYADDGGFQELFIAEARLSARLEHQNVVRVHQFNREGSLYYLVMEFIDGVTFRRLISQARRSRVTLTPAIVAELGRQACEGLSYAHTLPDVGSAGLVHRDVKPSNLMLTTQGVVKVLDFGISGTQGSEATAAAEGPAVKGTWGYMAPEQADGRTVGPSADLFGLAAVLYELATGEALFEDKEHAAIRAKLAQDEGARRAAALGGPWRELGSILVRALQRDPAARFPSAGALGRALAALVPDRLAVQEQLVTLVRDAAGQEAPAAPSDRPRSFSTMPRQTGASQSGLPVVVGDDRGPARTTGTGRPTRRTQPSQTRTSLAILGVMLVALGVLGGAVLLLPTVRGWLAETSTGEGVVEAAVAPEPPGGSAGGSDVTDPGSAEALANAPAGEVTIEPTDPGTEKEAAAPNGECAGVAPATSRAAVSPAPASLAPASPASPPPAAADIVVPPAEAPAPAVVTRTPAKTTSAAPTPTSAAPQAGEGLLTLSSVPRAQVMLDGTFAGWTPYFQVPTASGAHTAVLVAEDGRRKTFKVTVSAGVESRKVWLFDEERWGE